MTAVVFYFQVHQPYRLRKYSFFDIGASDDYFEDSENERIVRRVAERCYVPMNELLLRVIERTEGAFRCSFSVSGTALRQMEDWAPEALDSFVKLAETDCVEFLCETSHHSLASQADPLEFERQVEDQRGRITRLFGKRPTTFRNTELVIDERVAVRVERLGFDTLLGEGADRLLAGRSPHVAYRVAGARRLKLLLRDYKFSDDVAFRFSNRTWEHYPLLADTFAGWLHRVPEETEFIGLFMDYETFGEHQDESTGVLEFMDRLPEYVLDDPRFRFATPGAVAAECRPADELRIPGPVSWADAERDLTAWLGNHMQRAAHAALYELGDGVRRAARAGREDLLATWRKLTTSDHVYYMCTKFLSSDGDVHEYFCPYESPHDAFIRFMNVVEDLSIRVARALSEPVPSPPSKK